MICCKIIADHKTMCLQLHTILNELNKYGSSLWDGNYLYFANVTDANIGDKKIRNIMKKYGCTQIFIEQYNKDTLPHESDQINWRIEDKLIKIGYVEFEENQQDVIKQTYQELSELNDMLVNIKAQVVNTNQK